MKFSQKRRDTFSKIEPWLYLSPFLIFIIIFTLYPVINVFTISLRKEKSPPKLLARTTMVEDLFIKDYNLTTVIVPQSNSPSTRLRLKKSILSIKFIIFEKAVSFPKFDLKYLR